ncbi:membrane protein [Hallella multisaccharivorax DSM 17128]|uniref:TonB-dependent receptor plug n=1 Tax=Hallella multisaccharivorax DSM 17128 TaxID=688246 RepID=F8NAY5_9BACT|nr:TonB-dependent receptor [Hallella multisaccharivorax]EGN57893.1 TonB-dependent receptor plug [Hallella multisaccharivorax DSM 17128]GJG30827.1 membrane protein [Hallella multisaccharivorax DSM 17128]
MKQTILILPFLLVAVNLQAQRTISGKVTDGHHAIVNANVFVKGTMDGTLTDSLGIFSFNSEKGDTLVVSCMGYDDKYLRIGTAHDSLHVLLRSHTASIDEVVVTGSRFSFGSANGLKRMGALDIVADGASCGDIVAALQSLPGTQKVGEDGKLYVRGGSSEECQTYINGMHVLQPYTTTAPNNSSRGRFSPFLFKGIDFSLGGYEAEYDQALSSVLPMETTDQSTSDKLGVSASLIDWNIGGTRAFDAGSLSMNMSYLDLGLYHRIFPDRQDWQQPYRQLSGEMQWKMQPTTSTVSKTYLGYDHTSLILNTDGRRLSLGENNIYFNSVMKGVLKGRVNWFAGMALSGYWQDIDEAMMVGDHFTHNSSEVHLKAKISKTFSSRLKMTAGTEDFIRHYNVGYQAPTVMDFHTHRSFHLPAFFTEALYRVSSTLFANASCRLGYNSQNHQWTFLPRVQAHYHPSASLQVSLSAGRYSQTAVDTILARSATALPVTVADHYIATLVQQFKNTTIRLEAYTKRYHHLPTWEGQAYTADGTGWSRGFDVFIDDQSLLPNLSTMVSYSYNNARRRWLDETSECRPAFSSLHNLRLSVKYGLGRFSLGLTESFASSRIVRGRATPNYNSLNASVSYLPCRRIIIYSSLSNLLGRDNVYGYGNDGSSIRSSSKRFFYLGIFISLKSNKAYDISNF